MLFAAFDYGYFLHFPLVLLLVSFVYSATRHDEWKHIFIEAGLWILRMGGFLVCLAGILYILSTWPEKWPYVAVPVGLGMAVYYTVTSPFYKKWRAKKKQAAAPTVVSEPPAK
jgi:uncharacterized membrane protein YfcA